MANLANGLANMIKLTFFGALSDLAASAPEEIEYDKSINTPDAIRQWLRESHSDLADELYQQYILVAINDTLSDWQTEFDDGSHLVFMPPVTGG